jgi:hypothetical protein
MTDTHTRLLQKRFSDRDWLAFGVNEVAYVRALTVDGEKVFAIHGADGSQLAVVPSAEIAWAAMQQHELEPVSLH